MADSWIRVIILEDHPMMRETLEARLVTHSDDMLVLYAGPSIEDAHVLAARSDVNCVILDLDLGDGTSFTENLEQVLSIGAPILIVSANASPSAVQLAMSRGVKGYVSKQSPPEEFIRAFDAVLTDQVSIQQIYDVRRAIELRTVALAALRRTPAEAAEILALTQRMERDFDQPEKVKESDIAFHEAIASASRNPLFALIVSAFRVITEKTWHISWSSRPTDAERHANVLCHRRIAEAIEQQRAREAEALMAEHFDNSVKALLAAGVT